MTRRLLNLQTLLLSLLLCVAVVVLRVRGVDCRWNEITGSASQVRGPHLGF